MNDEFREKNPIMTGRNGQFPKYGQYVSLMNLRP